MLKNNFLSKSVSLLFLSVNREESYVMFLLLMITLATTLTVSISAFHQTIQMAVAIPLNAEIYCNNITPEINRTSLLSKGFYTIEINASNMSTILNSSDNVVQHDENIHLRLI